MKKLSNDHLATIEAAGFWDGVCAAVGLARALGPGILALGPIGAGVLTGATVGCIIYKLAD